MKIESRKCISIRKIAEYHGTDVATILPQIYTVTGFVTTSFLHFVDKIKVLKKFLSGKEKLRVLDTNGASCKVSETLVKDVEKLIETVCYSGKEVKGF